MNLDFIIYEWEYNKCKNRKDNNNTTKFQYIHLINKYLLNTY